MPLFNPPAAAESSARPFTVHNTATDGALLALNISTPGTYHFIDTLGTSGLRDGPEISIFGHVSDVAEPPVRFDIWYSGTGDGAAPAAPQFTVDLGGQVTWENNFAPTNRDLSEGPIYIILESIAATNAQGANLFARWWHYRFVQSI